MVARLISFEPDSNRSTDWAKDLRSESLRPGFGVYRTMCWITCRSAGAAAYPPVGSVSGDQMGAVPMGGVRPVDGLTAGDSKDAAGRKTARTEDAAKTWGLKADAAKMMVPRASTMMRASVPTAVSGQRVDGTVPDGRWSLVVARFEAVCLAGTQTEDDPFLTTGIRHPAFSLKSDAS